MKINTKIRYGLRMLVLLADHPNVVNTVELGKKMLVSPKYLRKLAGPMEKAGLIKSIQGVYGGYTLNQKAADIPVSAIFEAFKEDEIIAECLSKTSCPLSNDCLTRPLWIHLQKVVQREFYKITIQDILDQRFPGID